MNSAESALPASEAAGDKPVEKTWDRVDRLMESLGERLNPILVKEARQALKSRQFLVTFSLMLVFSWCWSIGGIAIQSGAVYYGAGGAMMFLAFFVILAVPMLVVVPFTAFRSLAAEREDGTYELLSITALSARQVITGKLGSAVLQMIVYYSAMAPCIVFTYLLRGVDIVSLLLALFYTLLLSLLLSVQALLMATLSRSTQVQVMVSIVLILQQMAVLWGWVAFVFTWFLEEAAPYDEPMFWVGNVTLLTMYASYIVLLIQASTAQISFPSENRSTRLRVTLLVQQMLAVGWIFFFWLYFREAALLASLAIGASVHWMVMGALMMGEVAQLAPRALRSLPQTMLGRILFTWFNPGSGTGFVFAVCNMLAVVGTVIVAMLLTPDQSRLRTFPQVLWMSILPPAYAICYIGLARLIVISLRPFRYIGILGAFVLNLLLVLAGTLGPFVLQMLAGKYMGYDYTWLQTTNWAWTLFEVGDDSYRLMRLPFLRMPVVVVIVPLAAAFLFLLNLIFAAREVAQVRRATPKRVVEDDVELQPVPPPEPATPTSPFDD